MSQPEDQKFKFDALRGTDEKPRKSSKIPLRVSLVVMALTVVAFTLFAPAWMNRGVAKVSEERLRIVAADTARLAVVNNWTEQQTITHAKAQQVVGEQDLDVKVTVNNFTVTVQIVGTVPSSNPFSRILGSSGYNRILVKHAEPK